MVAGPPLFWYNNTMIYTREKLEKLEHRWTTPQGKRLLKTIKKSRCYLSPVLFKQKVKNFPYIKDAEVLDGVDLRGAPFAGYDFRVPVQEDDEGFAEELAILSNIHFEGANLKHSTFQDGKVHDCYFEGANLSHAEFQNATLNNCGFQEADLQGANLQSAKIIACSFVDATIKDMTTANAVVDQKSEFGKELKSEKEDNYHFASIEYKQIKQMYKNSSLHNLADQYHYREMVAKRKVHAITNPARWLNYIFGDLLSKYGTSFVRVLVASAIVVLICAVLFTTNASLLFHNQPVDHAYFMNSLYFSLVTFTTVGYGDFHAVGALRFLAAFEAFAGAALMALFTVIVARSIIRD